MVLADDSDLWAVATKTEEASGPTDWPCEIGHRQASERIASMSFNRGRGSVGAELSDTVCWIQTANVGRDGV